MISFFRLSLVFSSKSLFILILALKWSFKTLVPFNKLKQLYNDGCRYTYEFAERLGVTEDLIEKAYNYYLEGNNG